MPQIEVEGEIEEVKQRVESLLTSSGLQVFSKASDSLRFRKVRLTPSRKLPLSIYGSGLMRLDESGSGSTKVTYNLNISPAALFSFAITGFSIIIFAAFVDFFLLTSRAGITNEVIIDVSVVSILSLLVIIVLIFSFVRTKRRAERFLVEFLEASARLRKPRQ